MQELVIADVWVIALIVLFGLFAVWVELTWGCHPYDWRQNDKEEERRLDRWT